MEVWFFFSEVSARLNGHWRVAVANPASCMSIIFMGARSCSWLRFYAIAVSSHLLCIQVLSAFYGLSGRKLLVLVAWDGIVQVLSHENTCRLFMSSPSQNRGLLV